MKKHFLMLTTAAAILACGTAGASAQEDTDNPVMQQGFVTTNLFTNAPREADAEEHKLPPRIICTTPERVANAAIKAIYRNRRRRSTR